MSPRNTDKLQTGGRPAEIFRYSRLPMAILACSFVVSAALGQSNQKSPGQDALSTAPPMVTTSAQSSKSAHLRQSMLASLQSKGEQYTYEALAGIDKVKVEETASGALLRFSYRVLDVNKAKALHDERSKPYLIDEKRGAVLQVPNLPKVGELRPKITPENGKEYWMVFSNKGLVRPGDRVDVVIGSFRAVGLMVH